MTNTIGTRWGRPSGSIVASRATCAESIRLCAVSRSTPGSIAPRSPRYDRRMGELTGRVALVTGAGRGIGRATALALRRDGAQVVAVARSADELASLHEECGAVPVPVALDEAAGCAAAVAAAR